jgi:hypothetical protein
MKNTWLTVLGEETHNECSYCFQSQRLLLSTCSLVSIILKTSKFIIAEQNLRVFKGFSIFILSFSLFILVLPIAVVERSKARTVFAHSNTEIMGSNPTETLMFLCVLCAFFLCLPHVEADKNTSTVIPASRKRRQKGNPVVSGETVPADLRKG